MAMTYPNKPLGTPDSYVGRRSGQLLGRYRGTRARRQRTAERVQEAAQFGLLLGSDQLGRDLFSRIVYAARVSLFIGLAGVLLSFFLGILLGGISGYFGGVVDLLIQRLIEFIISIPQIPLWMGLSAAIPQGW